MKLTHCALLILLSCPCWVAGARARDPEVERREAAEHFDRGVMLVNDGDLSGGLAEFHRTYELAPSPVVLYNIGLVDAALHRAVAAVRALDQVLTTPAAVKPEQVERARQVLDEQRQRIGRVRVTCNVHEGVVEVDNVEVARLPLQEPIEVQVGPHVIGVVTQGHAPARREVLVASGAESEVALELVPIDGRLAHIVVRSAVPGATVRVDGEAVGVTPLDASITVVPGQRTIELLRAGYTTSAKTITLQDGAQAELSLQPQVDPEQLGSEGGTLAIRTSEEQAQLTLDDRVLGLLSEPLLVPRGPHRVHVERSGFLPAQRDVEVPLHGTASLMVTFEPTPSTRAQYVERARRRRMWSWITAGTGIAVLGAGAGMGAAAMHDMDGAKKHLSSVNAEWVNRAGGPCDHTLALSEAQDASCRKRLNDATDKVDHLKTLRAVCWTLAGVGGAVLVAGVVLLLTGPDPHRYDVKPKNNWEVIPTLSRGDFGLSATSRF